jgi:hypothetical protein
MALHSPNDVMDLLASCFGKPGLVVTEADLGEAFFDLRTGIAGELFQKFTNYNVRLAIVLPERNRYGDRLRELAGEHDRHPLIRFVADTPSGERWISATRS